jgi:hypothetical protein
MMQKAVATAEMFVRIARVKLFARRNPMSAPVRMGERSFPIFQVKYDAKSMDPNVKMFQTTQAAHQGIKLRGAMNAKSVGG